MSDDCQIRFGHHGACSRGSLHCVVDHEMVALGRRLMAIPGYVPGHGMIDTEGRTCDFVSNGQVWTHDGVVTIAEFIPDLSQGATRGVLLDQVRAALGDPRVAAVPKIESGTDARWAVVNHHGMVVDDAFLRPGGGWVCMSEAEALVLAREVAER